MKNSTKYLLSGATMLGLTLSAICGVHETPEPRPLVVLEEPATHAIALVDFSSGVARALPSIVTIRTGAVRQVLHREGMDGEKFNRGPQGDESQNGTGSGVIASIDGHIITNHHVIEGAGSITVELHDGRQFQARVIGSDPASDLALLKVDANGLIPAEFTSSYQIRLGEAVAAIGNPFDVGISISTGVVSATGRHGTSLTEDDYFIQTDAALNPGNSGGALINRHGQVIGINTAIYSRTGSNTGVGFAVPSITVQAICEQLREHGNVRRGMLGVTLDLDRSNLPGVTLEEVATGSPAEDAGLQPGDRIMAVENHAVLVAADLRNHVRLTRVGETLTLTILRDGENQEVEVILGAETTKDTLANRPAGKGRFDKDLPPSTDRGNPSDESRFERIHPH